MFMLDSTDFCECLVKTISIIMSLQKLHSRLCILSKPMEDLVSQYLSDLAKLQPRDDDERGGGGGGEEEIFGMLHFWSCLL